MQKLRLESLKKFHEKQSRSYNEVDYTIAKRYFTKALAEFKTFGLSEEDSNTVSSFETVQTPLKEFIFVICFELVHWQLSALFPASAASTAGIGITKTKLKFEKI